MIRTMFAQVEVKVGMRVRFDCQLANDYFRSTSFFQSHQGKMATITALKTENIGLHDSLEPGIYHTGGIYVRFDGEDKIYGDIPLEYFTLLSQTTTLSEIPEPQRISPLLEPIKFYPGDLVTVKNTGVSDQRKIVEIKFAVNGRVLYGLSRPEDGNDLMKLAKSLYMTKPGSQIIEGYADDLVMVKKGNLHFLYTEPEKIEFKSMEKELDFWSGKHTSCETFNHGKMMRPSWCITLKEARTMLNNGSADFFIEFRHEYIPHLLHPRFKSYRDRVMRLSLSLYR